MTNFRKTSADGSFLGFLYQIERAMLWLSKGGEGMQVGIETDEDVVVQLQKGEDIKNIYEQAKHAQTNRIPFADQSEDLWKTLHNWVNAIKENRVDINTSILSAVTNKKLPSARLILTLSNASIDKGEKMKAAIDSLRTTASKLSKDNQAYGQTILECDEEFLAKLIDRIHVFDSTCSHDSQSLKKELISNLSLSPNLPFDHIYQSLFGAVTNHIITCWKNREEAWIDVTFFNNLYNDLIAQYIKKPFIERTIDLLPVTDQEISQNKGKVFVRQLHAIDCESDEILEAINDYQRSMVEKGRHAKEFAITEDKYLLYYDDLKKYWDAISRPRFRMQGNVPNIGYEVFYETVKYKGKLNGHEPEQAYTYKGAYHYLADRAELGWHPEWKNKISEE